jgi:hypothetical protein
LASARVRRGAISEPGALVQHGFELFGDPERAYEPRHRVQLGGQFVPPGVAGRIEAHQEPEQEAREEPEGRHRDQEGGEALP